MIKYIHELPGGGYRPATEEEIREAEEAGRIREGLLARIENFKKELQKYEKCPHTVCYDEPGFPYNVRICCSCGNRSLL